MYKDGKLNNLFAIKGENVLMDRIRKNTQYKKGCKRPEMMGDNSPMRRPEVLKKSLKRRYMSSLEIRFNKIVKDNNLPYKFVGDGSVLVGHKSPDFVHNNKKVAVEVFDIKHKDRFRGGCNMWKKQRKQYFNKKGWDIKFFSEKMLCNRIVNKELYKL